jgi:hypothetical protein
MNSISKKFSSNKRRTKYIFALMNDIYLSENHPNLKLTEKHLKEAIEKNARILLNGNTLDFFRENKDFSIRKNPESEFQKNLSIDFAYEFLKPFASNIDFISYKDSEHTNTLPLKKLISRLNYSMDTNILMCPSKNWFTINFQMGHSSYKYRIFSDEGKTKSPVTKGKIQHSRLAEKIDGADVIWLFGKGNDYEHSRIIETLNSKNEILHKEILELRTPSYYKKKTNGTENEVPESAGGRWLEIELHRSDKFGILMTHKSYKI